MRLPAIPILSLPAFIKEHTLLSVPKRSFSKAEQNLGSMSPAALYQNSCYDEAGYSEPALYTTCYFPQKGKGDDVDFVLTMT